MLKLSRTLVNVRKSANLVAYGTRYPEADDIGDTNKHGDFDYEKIWARLRDGVCRAAPSKKGGELIYL